jgi:hypothetical protein
LNRKMAYGPMSVDAELCISKSAKSAKNLGRGMWQSSHTARAMRSGLRSERNRAGDQVLSNRVFGWGEIITSSAEYWIDGAYGPLRRRHSGKGRAVPGRRPSIRILLGSLRSTHFARGSARREIREGKINAWFASHGARRMG